ncbi:serine hydrolase domain-containing protein [Cytophagaceae bacterium DM2B3-1]|uniref:Serine hydrolase domain-containing protein n=1 Tax=Xanthocytophaga flava TaxID=3048013 RepID=A0ABT7CR87_9BACT|nr:serine hydrolase domain-containing protein [Xanthocytophaga flavus]MDJ1466911.1 serine hydrolase domain-containing protein [Xanthocytophaga flavus]MDJ1496255.1 serine hydrolase domain-containing protein [Xanthocytophaga flavus]
MKTLIFILTITCFISSNPLYAQHHLQQIDSLVTKQFANYELAGNILIAQKGAIIYQKSLGLADVRNHVPVDEHSAFQLASVSKLFTSVAILQLKQKRKLKLDDPVKTYLPTFRYSDITIRHLLSHTSGLTDFQMLEKPYAADTAKQFTIADLVPAINQDDKAILFKPGEKWSYSNSGYGLLALIVEKVSGLSFPSYLTKYIFQPAGMNHTYVNTPILKVADKHRVKGYDYPSYAPWIRYRVDSLPHNRIELYNLGGIIGPGNVISTTSDLLLFDRALYGSKLLKPSTLQEALTPTRLANQELATAGWGKTDAYYGLGWMILKDTTYGKVVFHSGGMPGAVTLFLRNITKDQTVILLNNVTHRGTHPIGVYLFEVLNGGSPTGNKQSLANLYTRTLFKTNAEEALAKLNIHKTDTAHYYLNEQEMNRQGLQLFYQGYQPAGLEVLRLNTILYSASWNVYDSYAQVLKAVGRRQESILMYHKSLELNPKNKGAEQALAELLPDKK